MYTSTLAVAALVLCWGHISESQTVDDAETALMSLRQRLIKNLNAVYDLQSQMSVDIDTAAAKTKADGKAACLVKSEVYDAALDACVNKQADAGISIVEDLGSDLLEGSLSTIYSEQSNLVHCAVSDSDCFQQEIDNLQKVGDSWEADINAKVAKARKDVDAAVATIQDCASSKNVKTMKC